jgi:hypothetical protein
VVGCLLYRSMNRRQDAITLLRAPCQHATAHQPSTVCVCCPCGVCSSCVHA